MTEETDNIIFVQRHKLLIRKHDLTCLTGMKLVFIFRDDKYAMIFILLEQDEVILKLNFMTMKVVKILLIILYKIKFVYVLLCIVLFEMFLYKMLNVKFEFNKIHNLNKNCYENSCLIFPYFKNLGLNKAIKKFSIISCLFFWGEGVVSGKLGINISL